MIYLASPWGRSTNGFRVDPEYRNCRPGVSARVDRFSAIEIDTRLARAAVPDLLIAGCGSRLASEYMRRSFDGELIGLRNGLAAVQGERDDLSQALRTAAIAFAKGSEANNAAKQYIAQIPGLVERSCSGGSSGVNPANYPKVLEAADGARGQLDIVQSALDAAAQYLPDS